MVPLDRKMSFYWPSTNVSICSNLAATLKAKLLPVAITNVRRIVVLYLNVYCSVRYSSVTIRTVLTLKNRFFATGSQTLAGLQI